MSGSVCLILLEEEYGARGMEMTGWRSFWDFSQPRCRLLVCVIILYAGWAKFLFDGYSVYILDYLFRAVVVLIVFRHDFWADIFRLPERWIRAVFIALVVLYIEILLFNAYRLFSVPNPLFYNYLYPRLETTTLRYIDLSLGLVLVAISEELVFRYLFAEVWKAGKGSAVSLYLISSLVFGLLHAPQGIVLVILATLSGALHMYMFRTSRSLVTPVIVHYVIDLLSFSSIGCQYGIGACH